LTLLLSIGHFFILIFVSGRARRHVWRWDPAFELFEFLIELFTFATHRGGGLFQLFQAVHQFGNVAIDSVGILLRIGIGPVSSGRRRS
jgi:hypothetical protein